MFFFLFLILIFIILRPQKKHQAPLDLCDVLVQALKKTKIVLLIHLQMLNSINVV